MVKFDQIIFMLIKEREPEPNQIIKMQRSCAIITNTIFLIPILLQPSIFQTNRCVGLNGKHFK